MGKTTVFDGKKKCLKCGEEKDVSEFEFRVSHNGKKYYRSPCKACCKIRKKGYADKYRSQFREQINAFARDRSKERKKNGDLKFINGLKNARLKHAYGISLDDYNTMFDNQNGECYICHTKQQNLKKSLAVDHCHKTGKVRKLLCWKCNVIIGAVDENPEILKSLAHYVEEHSRSIESV